MLFYERPIKNKDMRRVAIQLMNKFPLAFKDKNDEESRLDNDYNGIFRKLSERYNYLHRTPK